MLRGERFTIDLSDSEGEEAEHHERDQDDHAAPPPTLPGLSFVGDIKERPVGKAAAAAIPSPPSLPKPTPTGFPAHKKRQPSAFKQRRNGQAAAAATAKAAATKPVPTRPVIRGSPADIRHSQEDDSEAKEKRRIDRENTARLAAMSEAQINHEREELVDSMPATLLERFLRRANIDETPDDAVRRVGAKRMPIQERAKESVQQTGEEDEEGQRSRDQENLPERASMADNGHPSESTAAPRKTVSFAESVPEDSDGGGPAPSASPAVQQASSQTSSKRLDLDDIPPNLPESELHAPSEFPLPPIHFPQPPQDKQVPNLDPNSPSFFQDLQRHYFPDIPMDPSSMSWLLPANSPYADVPTDESSMYHPASKAKTFAPAGVRFSLTGTILPPKKALALPTTLGLHHHASDPEAAGYTIPELSILSRSTVPGQRCFAWQMLGRILFRLGRGEFGKEGDPLVEGLWGAVERENIIIGMMAEAGDGDKLAATASATNRGDGDGDGDGDGHTTAQVDRHLAPEQKAARLGKHVSAKAYATEALWLWRRSGAGERGLARSGTSTAK
ncbi:hypothetical protein KEM52_002281 [Ascosphaera acerosa]|nr:hypothetical protein KEM52_002281 [Ascosphaera acerosa]